MTVQIFDWIYHTHKTALWQDQSLPEGRLQQEKIASQVRAAIEELSDLERLTIERHYFEGMRFKTIADEMGVPCSKVLAAHRRAKRRLQKLLVRLAQEHFGVPAHTANCPICTSRFRTEAEEVISARGPNDSYSGVIRELRERCDLFIISPKTIIGHTKYHC